MAYFEIIKKTPAEWTAANPILLDNEIGVEEDVRNNANTVPAKAKMGDNVTRWNDLEYWNPPDVPWTSASASGPASLAFAEDTDNGAHAVTLKAPAAVTADVDVTLPDAAGTLALTSGVIQKLSTTQVNTDDAAKQALYTVPDGKRCVPTMVVVRNASDDMTSYDDVLTFGFNAGGTATFEMANTQVQKLDSAAKSVAAGLSDASSAGTTGSAAEVFGCTFSYIVIDGTVDIDVFGYLVDA